MKRRHVFGTATVASAAQAVVAARAAGIPDERISLIARSDIAMEDIPDERIDVSTDTVPAALRGAATGGAMGAIGGLIAMAIPAVGITVAGVALLTAITSGVGAWSSALMGSTVANPIRQRFENEIEQGRILVVIDDDDENHALDATMAAAGAKALPYDSLSALE